MINPTGCYAIGDCEFIYSIVLNSSTKVEIKKEMIMHETEEVRKYSDIQWSYCTFREMPVPASLVNQTPKDIYICYLLSKVSDSVTNKESYETNIFVRSKNSKGVFEFAKGSKIRDGNQYMSFARNPKGWDDIVWYDNDAQIINFCKMDKNESILNAKAYNSECRSKERPIKTTGNEVL